MNYLQKLKAHLLNGGKVVFNPNRKGKPVWAGQVCAGCFKKFQRPHGYPEYCSECDDKAIQNLWISLLVRYHNACK